jgi:hypothetical protein
MGGMINEVPVEHRREILNFPRSAGGGNLFVAASNYGIQILDVQHLAYFMKPPLGFFRGPRQGPPMKDSARSKSARLVGALRSQNCSLAFLSGNFALRMMRVVRMAVVSEFG